VLGAITGYEDLTVQVGGVSNLRQYNVVMSPAVLGPKNDCDRESQQQLLTTDSSSRQRGCYIRTMKASVQSKKLAIVSLKGRVAKTN
jgi:hypothetical protein